MKLSKLSFDELESVFSTIPSESLSRYMGGYGGDGNCYFNCLEFLSRKFNGPMNYHDYQYYANDYTFGNNNKYDDWKGLSGSDRCADTVLNGPKFYDENSGEINSATYDYIASQFKTEGSRWVTGNYIKDMFSSSCNSYGTGYIIGTMVIGCKTAHAAIFTGYDPDTDTYSYYNPEDKGCICRVKASDVISAIRVVGKK